MALTDQRVSEILAKLVPLALCVGLAILVGWWIPRAHYLLVIASLLAIGFAGVLFVYFQAGIMGLLLFAPILKILGLAVPLPLGVNEFNIIVGALLFITVARFTLTKHWGFKISHPWISWGFLLYFTLILISSFRGYLNFPNLDLVRTNIQIESRINVITSQFFKPVLYMSMLFFGYNYAPNFAHRRNLIMAMGCWLALYAMTMFLQDAGLFPILSTQLGKEAGGILGSSNVVGVLLAFYFVLFLARKPYFDRGGYFLFSWVIVIISVLGIVYSRSRTAWILSATAAFFLAATTKRWSHRFVATVCVILVVATSPVWAPQQAKDWWEQTTTAQQDDPNAVLSGRVEIWTAALQYLKSSPLILFFGGGKLDFYTKGPEYGLRWGFTTHHQVMQSLVDEGVVGLLVVLGLFGRIMWGLARAWREEQDEEVRNFARLMTIITMLVIFSGESIDGRTVTWYWFLLGMFLAAKDRAASATAVQVESIQPQNLAPARPRSVPQWAVRRDESRA